MGYFPKTLLQDSEKDGSCPKGRIPWHYSLGHPQNLPAMANTTVRLKENQVSQWLQNIQVRAVRGLSPS